MISRGGSVACPPRSVDNNPVDFYLWGTMKYLVYAEASNTIKELIKHIQYSVQSLARSKGKIWLVILVGIRAQALFSKAGAILKI